MEVGKKYFEQLIDKMKAEKGVTSDLELDASDLKKLAEQFKAEYKKQIGEDFPSDPKVQLYEAIRAVFRSWDNPRANVYRRDNDIPYSWGTAVNVMPMVFGNLNENSGTGVAFTRDPATGEKKLMGEFLVNALLCPSLRWQSSSPKHTLTSSRSAASSRSTTAICRTWSSPSRTASSTCSSAATASVPLRQLSKSHATSLTRA